MAYPLLFVGLILFVTGITGKTELFAETVKSDLTGGGTSAPFAVWIAAVFAIGLLGAAKPLRPVSDAFMILIVLAFLISNQGLIGKVADAFGVKSAPALRDGPKIGG